MTGTPFPRRQGIDDLDHDEFERLYGRWAGLRPTEFAELLHGVSFPWWIAGGWSIEAAIGVERFHEDIDVIVLRRDLPALRAHLESDWHLWSPNDGTLAPLLPGDTLPDDHEQCWLRKAADQPWVADVLLTPADGDDWLYKRDHRLRVPLDDLAQPVGADGIRYVRPEIALLFKAKGMRAKDLSDFEAALPRLGEGARRWLADALALTTPGHEWATRLSN